MSQSPKSPVTPTKAKLHTQVERLPMFFGKFSPTTLMSRLEGSEQEQELSVDGDEDDFLFRADFGENFPSTATAVLNRLLQFNDVVCLVNQDELKQTLKQLMEQKVVISVLGRYQAGKSTLLNALVADELLPVNAMTETAVKVYIQHDDHIHSGPCPSAATHSAADSFCERCPVLMETELEEKEAMPTVSTQVIAKGTQNIRKKLAAANKEVRNCQTRITKEYMVRGNVPAMAGVPSPWKVCLTDNPGFGEIHQQEIMRMTEVTMATSSAYIYVVAYRHIGDTQERGTFEFIHRKDRGVFQDNRILVAVTCFDERYDALFEDEVLTLDEIRKHISTTTAKATDGTANFAPEAIIPVCSQWAFIARQLKHHPNDENLMMKARTCLEDYGAPPAADASPQVIAGKLEEASGIASVEARIQAVVRAASQIWLQTIRNSCGRYLQHAIDSLNHSADDIDKRLADYEESCRHFDERLRYYQSQRADVEQSLGKESKVYHELSLRCQQDMEVPTSEGARKALLGLTAFEEDCNQKCSGKYTLEEFDKDLKEFLKETTELVHEVFLGTSLKELKEVYFRALEKLGTKISDLRSAAEDVCVKKLDSSLSPRSLRKRAPTTRAARATKSRESLGYILSETSLSLEGSRYDALPKVFSPAQTAWQRFRQQSQRLRKEDLTDKFRELKTLLEDGCAQYSKTVQPRIVKYYHEQYRQKGRRALELLDDDFQGHIEQLEQEVTNLGEGIAVGRRDTKMLRLWAAHLDELQGHFLLQASKFLRKFASEVSTVTEIALSEVEVENKLGSGGQAEVYKGRWKSRNLVVAVKIVTGKIRAEEVEILSKVNHRNIIRFYGVVDRKPYYYIITEFAEGGSLYDHIYVKNYQFNLEESLQWAREIAEGMNYLHQQRVIHRDLKSKNVLLTSGTVKLCDFGSAKDFDHTSVQTTAGTFRWMAPEVMKKEKVSLSCDVFSYGMVLFEIFKQELPFSNIADMKVPGAIMEGKTPDIPDFLEPYLCNLMKRCWKTKPKARPSFREILIMLKMKKDYPEPVNKHSEAAVPKDKTPTGTQLTPKDLSQLQTCLEDAAGSWYPLGVELKFASKQLLEISRASGNDVSTALSIVLLRWLKTKDPPPTLEGLADALSSSEVNQSQFSAILLEEKHKFGKSAETDV